MSGLREQIAEEARIITERRLAAAMLSTNSFVEWESEQEERPSEAYVISRDPCPKCGVRGDLECPHREASQPEEAPHFPQRGGVPFHMGAKFETWPCGHPRSPANTHPENRCLKCRRDIERKASQRYRERRAR